MSEKKYSGSVRLDAYRGLISEIDGAIEKVRFLLGGRDTYFAVRSRLTPILMRLDSDEIFKKITKENNEPLLDERKKALPYRDTIARLIDDIDTFAAESKRLCRDIINSGTLDSAKLDALFPYLLTLAEDYSSACDMYDEIVGFFCEDIDKRWRLDSADERVALCFLLIRIKAKGRYSFAYPEIADELVRLVSEASDVPHENLTDIFTVAGDYYIAAAQREKAMRCYKSAADAARDSGDNRHCAYLMRTYYRLAQSFPENIRIKMDAEAIKREHGEYADIVLGSVNTPMLKVDPIEFSVGFTELFQTVMHKVENEINDVGDLHIPHQRWSLMRKYFAEAGIFWRDPSVMNPGVMFD